MTETITLKSVVCPGCAKILPIDNQGCTNCGYEDNTAGRILPLEEIMTLPVDDQVHTFNDVSPAFIVAIVQAAQADQQAYACFVPLLDKRPLINAVGSSEPECQASLALLDLSIEESDRVLIKPAKLSLDRYPE